MGRGVHQRRVLGRWTGLLLAASCAVAALGATLPATAAAEEANANLRHSPGESAEFTVAASSGYRLLVKKERHLVTLTVSRARPPMPTISNDGRLLPANTGSTAASVYNVVSSSPLPASADTEPGTIETDLGALGRIAVTFQPSGRTKVTKVDLSDKTERCVGATKVVRRLGTFTGTISFHGENGYTSVDLTSAPGTVGTSPLRDCRTRAHKGQGNSPASGTTGPSGYLDLQGREAAASLFAGLDGGSAFFTAFSDQSFPGSVVVVRMAMAKAPAGCCFRVRGEGARATIAPRGPFSGSAVYRARKHGPPTWKGDLSVEFPGLVVPLTGPGFDPPKLRLSGF